MGHIDSNGLYHLMDDLKINHEVKINEHYIRMYNPKQSIINDIFVVIDLRGNMICLDKKIPGDDGENYINRYYLDRYKSNITKRVEQGSVSKVKQLTVKTVPSPHKTIIPKKEEIKQEDVKLEIPKRELTLLEQLEQELNNNKTGFFEVDVIQIQKDYIDKVNKMKAPGFEKNKLIEQIKQKIKKFGN